MSAVAFDTRTAQRVAARAPELPKRALAHIPGDEGWPLIGNTLQVLADPLANVRAMHAKFGPVYRSRPFGARTVTLLGPEANEFVLFDQSRLFSSEEGWAPILGRLFPRGLMLLDFDEHRAHRRAMSIAFKAGPMKSYLAALDRSIVERVARWRTREPELLFYPAIKQLTLDLAATSFLGDELGQQSDEIKSAFVAMVAAAVGAVRKPIPGTQMHKGVRGRVRIVDIFSREVPKRRAGTGEDIFSQLCRTTHEDGALLSTQEIVDHMSFLLMAAHDTLTSSITTLVWLIATHPDWQEKLRAEAMAVKLAPGEPFPYERLSEFPLTEMAFKEAMRINPPVPGIPRRAVRDFEFGGFRIPAGTRVSISPLFTHRMPAIWPEPDAFDPMRFTDATSRARHKFAWVPFSGGAHMCIGLHFAYMQAKCFFHRLLTTARVSVAPGYRADWKMLPIPQPRDGLPVSLRPL